MKKLFVLLLISLNLLSSIKVVRAEGITYKDIFISEFLPDGVGADAGKEWIELFNNKSEEITLTGYKLKNKSLSTGNERIINLPEIIIKPKSFFIIVENSLIFNETNSVAMGDGKLNLYNSNSELSLVNTEGVILDSFSYTTSGEGKSWERKGPSNETSCSEPVISSTPTINLLNGSNDEACWFKQVEEVPPPSESISAIEITEVLFSLDGKDYIPDINFEFEGESTAIYLGFNTNIELTELFEVKYFNEAGSEITNPFVVKEYIGRVKVDLSSGGKVVSKWSSVITVKPKVMEPSLPQKGKQESIIITEIYATPERNLEEKEWVEIYNQDILNVDLAGMYFLERAGDVQSTKKSFLPSVTLAPHSYFVIYEKDLTITLNNSGDHIYLYQGDDTIVDNFRYSKLETNTSASRIYKDNLYLVDTNKDVPETSIPTPGSDNKHPSIPSLKISESKLMKNSTVVEVQGTVSVNFGILGDYFYIQDESGGLKVTLGKEVELPDIAQGTNVKIIGEIKRTKNELTLNLDKVENVNILSVDNSLEPVKLVNVDNSDGLLVKVEGNIVKNYSSSFDLNYANNTIPIRISILDSTGIEVSKNKGDTFKVTGILQKYNGTFRILPRTQGDIELVASVVAEKNTKPSTPLKKTTKTSTGNVNSLFDKGVNYQIPVVPKKLESDNESSTTYYLWPVYIVVGVGAVTVLYSDKLRNLFGVKYRVLLERFKNGHNEATTENVKYF